MGAFTISFRDHTNEPSTVVFPGEDLTAANHDAQVALTIALLAAIGDVSIGELQTSKITAQASVYGVGPAASALAQREAKAVMLFHDDTTFDKGRLEIPIIDLSKQNPDYPGIFYLPASANNNADWTAFVTAVEDYVVLNTGNSITVDRIYHVGKNL